MPQMTLAVENVPRELSNVQYGMGSNYMGKQVASKAAECIDVVARILTP